MHGPEPDSAANPGRGIPLDAADSVARAAHLWLRSLNVSESRGPVERRALAAGLLAGLCEQLDLEMRVLPLVSYAYSLMDGDGSRALAISRTMLDRPYPEEGRPAFERGRLEAVAIIEMLACRGDKT